MALGDLHDDEVRARLGLPIERERDYEGPIEELRGKVEDRIEAAVVAMMPEEFDPETEADFELLDMTKEVEGGD